MSRGLGHLQRKILDKTRDGRPWSYADLGFACFYDEGAVERCKIAADEIVALTKALPAVNAKTDPAATLERSLKANPELAARFERFVKAKYRAESSLSLAYENLYPSDARLESISRACRGLVARGLLEQLDLTDPQFQSLEPRYPELAARGRRRGPLRMVRQPK